MVATSGGSEPGEMGGGWEELPRRGRREAKERGGGTGASKVQMRRNGIGINSKPD